MWDRRMGGRSTKKLSAHTEKLTLEKVREGDSKGSLNKS